MRHRGVWRLVQWVTNTVRYWLQNNFLYLSPRGFPSVKVPEGGVRINHDIVLQDRGCPAGIRNEHFYMWLRLI